MRKQDGLYWDKPWSLVSGCTPCSPGCDHCWSLAMEKRFHKGPPVSGRGIWLHPDRLDIPVKRRKPTVYAIWNDLFHGDVPQRFIDDALGVMAACPHHTFLVLTKRAGNVDQKLYGVTTENPCRELGGGDYLPNLWSGLTICNQAEADAKIPTFLQVPGKKFLSIEPMLSAINLSGSYHNFLEGWDTETEAEYDRRGDPYPVPVQVQTGKIDAAILGGETGPGARPMHPDWVRSVRDQCAAAGGVAFFFKGWGEWRPESQFGQHVPSLRLLADHAKKRFHQWSDGSRSYRLNRAAAGRLLDGRTHDELPWRETK